MSTFSDSIYKIKATLVRRQIPLPPALYRGAFGIYPDSVTFKYSGSNDSIDGRDHDRNGKLLPASSDTVPPIEVRTVTDSISVLASGGVDSPVKLSTVVGSPKIWVDPGMSNPNTSSDSLKLIADSIIYSPANATVQLGDIGDSTHPKIVFCDGTNSGTGKTTGDFALNGDSWGILVVKGGLKLKANATWHGAVIQYGNVPLTFNASAGQSQIYGGLIMGGKNGGTYDMGGNSKVIHSREALNLRDKIKDPYIYQIVDWYE